MVYKKFWCTKVMVIKCYGVQKLWRLKVMVYESYALK